ncbi:hypothetical protein J6590_043900 [Homalodisca vitripennis]|nr:hypothetical protein J6590_043900 [Homalodisca vitripennis]
MIPVTTRPDVRPCRAVAESRSSVIGCRIPPSSSVVCLNSELVKPRYAPETEMNGSKSEIGEFFAGRSLLITGASGFMGKVLLEKLLYSCPDIHQIFILIRPKRGKTVEARIDEMFKSPMFHRLRDERPGALKKLVPFSGDVLQERLGLTEAAQKRLEDEVSVVIHSAATLRLESRLKDAVEMNLIGTYRVLELAKQIKNLKARSISFSGCPSPSQDAVKDAPIAFKHGGRDLGRQAFWHDQRKSLVFWSRQLFHEWDEPYPNRMSLR